MDTQQLKREFERYIASMKADGKSFKFVGMEPTYPGFEGTSYVLIVKADWIDKAYTKDVIDYMVDRMFDVLDFEVRVFISRIEILNQNDELHCGTECLVIVDEEKIA